MLIYSHLGLLKPANWKRVHKPTLIVLHDTAGPTLKSAEITLKQRGLGYHYMIDRDGSVHQYHDALTPVNHALGANASSVSISLVGGARTLLTNTQIYGTILLIKHILLDVPSITHIAGHKEVGKKQGKIDPEFPEYDKTMSIIAEQCGLLRITDVSAPSFLAVINNDKGCC